MTIIMKDEIARQQRMLRWADLDQLWRIMSDPDEDIERRLAAENILRRVS